MELTRQPISPVYAQQEVTFGFALESWEKLIGDYEFQIVDAAGNFVPFAGTASGPLAHYMDNSTVFKPTAKFPGPGNYTVQIKPPGKGWYILDSIKVDPPEYAPVVKVALQAGIRPASTHQTLWTFIKEATNQLMFPEFEEFVKESTGSMEHYFPYGSLTYKELHKLSTKFVTATSLGLTYSAIGVPPTPVTSTPPPTTVAPGTPNPTTVAPGTTVASAPGTTTAQATGANVPLPSSPGSASPGATATSAAPPVSATSTAARPQGAPVTTSPASTSSAQATPPSPPPTNWGSGATTAPGVDLSYVDKEWRNTSNFARPTESDFPLATQGQYPIDRVPFVELIYVYWLEEAMLFQSLNRILARFQNRRAPGAGDPLTRLAASPLLPLRGLLWGLAEAEKDRLSLRRRAAEYEYQYGLQLIGRAVPPAELLVERRTRFLEAFHNLLNACYQFYKEDSDTTINADAFPLLGNLQELHLVLSYGANNQFADAALAARIETLDVQWMLSQQEMREFLGGRTMVPYEERWMDRVDTMKSIQGWSDTSVTHFYDLAVHGEQLLLSVRHGRWNYSDMEDTDAKNWALEWKPSVQRYIHAYRAVTGVDLSERVDTTMPSTLLQRRLARKIVRY